MLFSIAAGGKRRESVETTGKVTIEDLVLASYRHEVAVKAQASEDEKLH
jgi:hypothetical protein